MPKGKGLLVYNPKAGNRDRRDEMFRTMERLDARGLSLVNLPTERAGHATELVRKHLAEGPDVVVVCGGDGTVGEAAAALVGTATPIAILPGGTTNVVAREYGIGLDMRRAEEIVLSDATRRLTTWTSAGRTSLIGTGVGFDGRVMTNIVPWLKRAFGRVGIGWTATLEWLKYEFPGIRVDGIDAEGRAFTREATFVLSANTRKYGGDPVLSSRRHPVLGHRPVVGLAVLGNVVDRHSVVHLLAHLFDKGRHRLGVVLPDAHSDEGDLGILLLKVRQVRDAHPTGAAPGRPEFHHVHLTFLE